MGLNFTDVTVYCEQDLLCRKHADRNAGDKVRAAALQVSASQAKEGF